MVNEINSENADSDHPDEPAVAAPAENGGSDDSDDGDESVDDDADGTTLALGGEDVGRVSECEAWVTKKNIILSGSLYKFDQQT